MTTVGLLGDRPHGHRDGPRASRAAGLRPRPLEPDAATAPRPWPRSSGCGRAAEPPRRSPPRRTSSITMLADEAGGRRGLRRARRAGRRCAPGARSSSTCSRSRRPSLRGHEAAIRVAWRGHARRPGVGQRRARRERQADADGRRRGRRPRAGPTGARGRRRDDLPPRAARERRRDEARRQHRHLRAQRGAGRGAGPRRARPASIARAAYDVLAASAVGAPYVGYKRAAFLDPEATPVAFSLDLAAKDLRLIAELAASVGRTGAAGRHEPRRPRGRDRGRRRWSGFPAVAGHLRDRRTAGGCDCVTR